MSEIFLFNTFVSHLRLRSEIVKDAGETIFLVKINFNNLPTIVIRENGMTGEILPEENSLDYQFQAGEFLYFSRKIEELITMIKGSPLKIGIYREGDSFPLCQVEIPLFGCACSLISSESEENSSKEFTIDGQFNLLDPGKNPAGEIFINAILVNCGRSISSYYRPRTESFLLKKHCPGTEYEFSRFSNDSKVNDEKKSENDQFCNYQQFYDQFIKDLIIIAPSSRYLSKEEKSTKTAHISGKKGKGKKSLKKKKKNK